MVIAKISLHCILNDKQLDFIFHIFLHISILYFTVKKTNDRLGTRALTGGFAVFKLLVVLSITKLYTHDITFSDNCNFDLTGILICKMLFLSSEKRVVLCFTSPVKLLLLSLKWFFPVKQSRKLRNKLIY